MKITSQNIRGMNAPHKQDILRNVVKDYKLDILLVQETKMSKDKVEKLRIFQKGGVSSYSSVGASRGSAIFWNLKTIKGEIVFEEP